MATNTKLTHLLKGRIVDSVRQRETDLDIDFDDGSTLSVKLSGPSNNVTLANDDGKEEYSE